MKRRFFGIFAAVCLCLTLLPTAALAYEYPDIYVCGTSVTSGSVTGTGITGTVSYDPDSKTLTLNGATLEYAPNNSNAVINMDFNGFSGNAFTIVLEGTNTITVKSNNSAATVFGIHSLRSTYIQGSGSLTIRFEKSTTSVQKTYGIAVIPAVRGSSSNGSLTVASGASVTVTAGDAESEHSTYSYGVYVNEGDVTVNGTLNATGGKANAQGVSSLYPNYTSAKSCGVQASGNVTVGAGGSLTAKGSDATSTNSNATSYGVCAGGSVTVGAGGSLNATAGKAENQSTGRSVTSCGVYTYNNVTVNGTLNATAGDASTGHEAKSYGVYAHSGDVTVGAGGTLNADAGKAESTSSNANSYGVYANGSLTVGGTLNANRYAAAARPTGGMSDADKERSYTSGDVSGKSAASYGVYACSGVTVNGSVTAYGGMVTATDGSAESYGFRLDANSSTTLTVGATGSLTGTGGSSATSCGIYVYNSSNGSGTTTVTLSGGTMLGQTVAALEAETDGGGSGELVPPTEGGSTDDGASALRLFAAGADGAATVEAPATSDVGIYVDTKSTNAVVDILSGTATGSGTDCGVYVKGMLKVGVGTVESVTLHAKASTGGKAVYACTTAETVTPLWREVEPHAVSVVKPEGGAAYTEGVTSGSIYAYATVLNGSDPSSGATTEAILQRSYVAPVEPEPETPSYTPVIALYPVIVEEAAHGAAESDRAAAAAGTTVTITVAPGAGYRLSGLTAVDHLGRAVELVERGDGVYTFTMPASKVTVTSAFTPTRTFTDVPAGSWYFDAVTWAVGSGITTGMTSTTFGPDLVCTRAQAVTFLYRAAKAAGVDVSVGEETNILSYNDALDIPEYAFEAFQWACGAGIVQGDSSGNLLPNAICTRTHIVTFLWRFAQVIGMDVSVGEETNILSYNDIFDVPEYAIEAFQWACGAGIVQGDSGNLLPNASCTRGQIVTMLYRMLGE